MYPLALALVSSPVLRRALKRVLSDAGVALTVSDELELIHPGTADLLVLERDSPVITQHALAAGSAAFTLVVTALVDESISADRYVEPSEDEEVLEDRLRRAIPVRMLRALAAARSEVARLENALGARPGQVPDLEVQAEPPQARDPGDEQLGHRLLANVTHELRTPLNSIIGFSELLEQEFAGPLSAAQRPYVSYILQSGRELLGLVNNALDLSRVQQGELVLNRRWLALPELARTVAAALQPFAASRHVTLHVGHLPSTPFFGDLARLREVVRNLVHNALKFTPAGGRVELRGYESNGWVRIDVIDTGVGLRRAELTRLFRAFEQVQNTTGGKPPGAGLGLPLVRALVELHGGSVSAISTLGEGSVFSVELPSKPISRLAGGVSGPLVMLIESDPTRVAHVGAAFEAAGCGMVAAYRADEIEVLATAFVPDAIMVDADEPLLEFDELLTRIEAVIPGGVAMVLTRGEVAVGAPTRAEALAALVRLPASAPDPFARTRALPAAESLVAALDMATGGRSRHAAREASGS